MTYFEKTDLVLWHRSRVVVPLVLGRRVGHGSALQEQHVTLRRRLGLRLVDDAQPTG